jgi:hypothetical protein
MKEINLKIESKEVKSEVRPIKAKWTQEMIEDLNHHHSLDLLLNQLYKSIHRKKTIKNIFPD